MFEQIGLIASFAALSGAALYLFSLSGETKAKAEMMQFRLHEAEREAEQARSRLQEAEERFQNLDRYNDQVLAVMREYERRFGPIDKVREG